MTKRLRTKIYIDKKEFFDEVCKFYDSKDDELSDNLLNMLIELITHYQRVYKYPNTEVEYDCKMQALMECIAVLKKRKFKTDKSSNAFSYFTSVVRNGLIHGFRQYFPRYNDGMFTEYLDDFKNFTPEEYIQDEDKIISDIDNDMFEEDDSQAEYIIN